MGLLSGLLGGDSKTKSEIQYPNYVNNAGDRALIIANKLKNQNYEKYPGERVAPISPNVEAASGIAKGMGDRQQLERMRRNTLNAANEGWQNAQATPFGLNTYDSPDWTQSWNQWMSPFTQGALQPAVRDLGEAFGRNQIESRSRAAAQGALGGAREAIVESENQRNYGRAVGDVLSEGYQKAYESGRQAFETERAGKAGEQAKEQALRQGELNRMLQAANIQNQTASTISDLDTNAIGALMQTGQYQEVRNQLQLDQNYQDWVEERDWGRRALDDYLRILGAGKGMSTGSTNTTKGGNTLGQLAGLAMAAYGLSTGNPAVAMAGANLSSGGGGGGIAPVSEIAPSTSGGYL